MRGKYVLSSGYTVLVKGHGPFALDAITQAYPDLLPPMRTIQLAAGDTGMWPYTPPEIPPSRDNPEEYDLYAQYKSWEWKNEQNRLGRLRAQTDFFKRNSIEIVGAPHFSLRVLWIRARGFIQRTLGKVVAPASAAYINFLDQEIIRSLADWKTIQDAATIPEVTMRGILDAARRFPGDVGGNSPDQRDVK